MTGLKAQFETGFEQWKLFLTQQALGVIECHRLKERLGREPAQRVKVFCNCVGD